MHVCGKQVIQIYSHVVTFVTVIIVAAYLIAYVPAWPGLWFVCIDIDYECYYIYTYQLLNYIYKKTNI